MFQILQLQEFGRYLCLIPPGLGYCIIIRASLILRENAQAIRKWVLQAKDAVAAELDHLENDGSHAGKVKIYGDF